MDRSSCTASRHGTYSAYRDGCRCDDAREDYFHYRKPQRTGRAVSRRVPALGYTRMVQALQAAGWPLWRQAQESGVTKKVLKMVGRRRWLCPENAARIDALYRQLSGLDGPSRHTENRAWAAGYPPPGAWIGRDIHDPDAVPDWIRAGDPDEVVAERVADGHRPLSDLGPYKAKGNRIVVTAEHVQAYERASRNGASDRQLIVTWQVSSKVIDRLRDEMRGAV